MDSASARLIEVRLRESHLGELEADVGVEMALGDGVKQLVVDGGGAMRLAFRGDAFAERVEGDGDALAVDGFGHAQSVFELHSGDKARAETCSESGVLAEAA